MKGVLLYFLLAASVMMVAQAASWKREEQTDAFSGKSYVQFTLAGTFLVAPRSSTLTVPKMIVHCVPGNDNRGHTKGKFLEGYIATGAVVESGNNRVIDDDNKNRLIDVLVRLDDGKPDVFRADRSTDFSGIFFTSPYGSGWEEFANLLYHHDTYHKENTNPQVRKVVLEVSEFVGGDIVMRFNLPDSDQVAEDCGIIWHKQAERGK